MYEYFHAEKFLHDSYIYAVECLASKHTGHNLPCQKITEYEINEYSYSVAIWIVVDTELRSVIMLRV